MASCQLMLALLAMAAVFSLLRSMLAIGPCLFGLIKTRNEDCFLWEDVDLLMDRQLLNSWSC